MIRGAVDCCPVPGLIRVRATKTRAGFPLVPLIFKVLAIPRRRTVRSREPTLLLSWYLWTAAKNSNFCCSVRHTDRSNMRSLGASRSCPVDESTRWRPCLYAHYSSVMRTIAYERSEIINKRYLASWRGDGREVEEIVQRWKFFNEWVQRVSSTKGKGRKDRVIQGCDY